MLPWTSFTGSESTCRSCTRRGTRTSTGRVSRGSCTSWDCPMASNRVRLAALLVGLAVLPRVRAETPSDEATMTLALPEGKAAEVSVSLGAGVVALDLPAAATLPKDFAAASGGLVRSGAVSTKSAERVRLDLILAGASLSGVSYGPTSLTLRFRKL